MLGAFLVGLGPWRGPQGSQMVDLRCQDTLDRWRWQKTFRGKFIASWLHTSHFKRGQRKIWSSWVHFRLVCGAERGPLASQMVNFECQDTDWVDGNDRPFRDKFTSRHPYTTKRKKWQKEKNSQGECPKTSIDDSISSVGYICSSYFWSS